MRLGEDWMSVVFDANDWDVTSYISDLVPITEIVPGDTIELEGHPPFLVDDVSVIREWAEQFKVRRYVVTADTGESYKLPGKRKVRRL